MAFSLKRGHLGTARKLEETSQSSIALSVRATGTHWRQHNLGCSYPDSFPISFHTGISSYKMFAYLIPSALLDTMGTIRKKILISTWRAGYLTEIRNFSGRKKKILWLPLSAPVQIIRLWNHSKCHQSFVLQRQQRLLTSSQIEKPIRSGIQWWNRSLRVGKENERHMMWIQLFTIIKKCPFKQEKWSLLILY